MHLDDSCNISEEGFPVHGGPQEKLRFLLNHAVLAPSGHNTHPCLFRLSGNRRRWLCRCFAASANWVKLSVFMPYFDHAGGRVFPYAASCRKKVA